MISQESNAIIELLSSDEETEDNIKNDIKEMGDEELETNAKEEGDEETEEYIERDVKEEGDEETEEYIEKDMKLEVDIKEVSNHLPENVKYHFVFIEIETMLASNSQSKGITQVGGFKAWLMGKNDADFFSVIEPKNLNYYLENYKMGGDLLQTLNIQKNYLGEFEFRKQFEIIEEGREVKKCINEETAMEALSSFLQCVDNCVIISLNEDNIELLMTRMKLLSCSNHKIDIQTVKGYCSWSSYLEQSGASKDELDQEFDDWFVENVKKPTSSKPYPDAVAKMVYEGIKETYKESGVLKGY